MKKVLLGQLKPHLWEYIYRFLGKALVIIWQRKFSVFFLFKQSLFERKYYLETFCSSRSIIIWLILLYLPFHFGLICRPNCAALLAVTSNCLEEDEWGWQESAVHRFPWLGNHNLPSFSSPETSSLNLSHLIRVLKRAECIGGKQ